MPSIQPSSEVKSADVTSRPDIERPGSEIFTCAEKRYEQAVSMISAKNHGGVQTHPARRGLGHVQAT